MTILSNLPAHGQHLSRLQEMCLPKSLLTVKTTYVCLFGCDFKFPPRVTKNSVTLCESWSILLPNILLRKLLFFANPAFLLGMTIHNVSAPKAKHQSAETDYNINRQICAKLRLCCIVVTAVVKTASSTAATMVFDSEETNLLQTWCIFCIFWLLKTRAETSYNILVLCLIICWEMG